MAAISRLLLSFVLVAMLCACGKTPVTTSDTTGSVDTRTGAGDAESKDAVSQENQADTLPAPGPYENILKDAEECKQGRYSPGSHGGRLNVITVIADPKTFNPWAADDAFSLELAGLLFRSLGDIDPYTGEIIPDMACEIKEEPDHLTYTTRLRKGLHWSDGRPITAEDVAYTWNTIIAQAYGNPSAREAALVGGKVPLCTAVDELTNKFVCAEPHVSFKRVLATFKIAPRHALETVINSKDGRADFKKHWSVDKDFSQIVSSGPFTVTEFVPGQRVEFSRAPNFYMIDKNGSTLPYLDRLVYIIEPEAGAVVLGFGKKEADLAQFRPKDKAWVSSQQAAQNYKLYNLGPSTSSFSLVFNMNQRSDSRTKKPLVDPARSIWFNDTNFRQAVNHAINRKAIIDDFFHGAGASIVCSEPSVSPFCNRSLKPFGQDLKYAQDLLSKSGFVKKPDGLLYDKEGKKVEFNCYFASASKLYQTAAQMISADLKQLGITANMEPLEANLCQELIYGKKPWECQLLSLSADPLDPNFSANVYRSNGHLHVFDQRETDWRGEIVATDARPWETRLDEIYEQAEGEFDLQKRKALYFEAQKIIYDEAPFIYLVSPQVLVGARNTVRNFSPTPLSQASCGLHNVEELYIDLTQTPSEKTAEAKK